MKSILTTKTNLMLGIVMATALLLSSTVWLTSTTTLPAAFAQASPTCEGETATIVGTNGNDNIVGTEGDDVIGSSWRQ